MSTAPAIWATVRRATGFTAAPLSPWKALPPSTLG